MTNTITKCATNTSNFNETSNLKLLVNFISVFEGVWVKFEKKRKSHFVLHIYRRADKNFQENWWPQRHILRPLLFLHPLSGGRRTRLTISYYCETSRLIYASASKTIFLIHKMNLLNFRNTTFEYKKLGQLYDKLPWQSAALQSNMRKQITDNSKLISQNMRWKSNCSVPRIQY